METLYSPTVYESHEIQSVQFSAVTYNRFKFYHPRSFVMQSKDLDRISYDCRKIDVSSLASIIN